MSDIFKTSRLGELGKVSMCKRVMKHQTSDSGDIPFYKISTFGGISDTFISNKLYQSFREKYSYPKIGDILISAAGTIGKTVIFNGEPSYFQDSNIVWIANDEKKVINGFLYYYYQTEPWIATKGSTINRLYNENIRSLKVTYPDISTQKQIAKVLSGLDAKIEVNNKINQELETMARTLYDYWFVQFDFPDTNGNPYKSSGGKMVYNEELKREIPEGWELKLIGNYFDYLEGPGIRKFNYSDDGHNFINIRCIKEGDLDVSNATKIKNELINNLSHFLLEENDVVVSTSGSLGRSAVVRKEHLPLLLNTSVIRFRPIKSYYHSFMVIYLKSQYFLGKLTQLATGSIQKNFGPTHLNQIMDCMPPDSIFSNFQKMVSPFLNKQILNKSENQRLTELRDWLLPMLMNGQVSVLEEKNYLVGREN